jgi:SAM-dependent methyltransferase
MAERYSQPANSAATSHRLTPTSHMAAANLTPHRGAATRSGGSGLRYSGSTTIDAYPLRMGRYDVVADGYDGHFDRPVDAWEDQRLAGFLAPMVDGADVLDLGCGTGWLLDHLTPASYVGLDASAAMLNLLLDKHPYAEVYKCEVGSPGWLAGQRWEMASTDTGLYDTVTATWAAEYFPHLGQLILQLSRLIRRGGHIALHGCQPRGSRRNHFISHELAHTDRNFTLRQVRKDTFLSGRPESHGTGALPDSLAHTRWLWQTANLAPARLHYGVLHVWRF